MGSFGASMFYDMTLALPGLPVFVMGTVGAFIVSRGHSRAIKALQEYDRQQSKKQEKCPGSLQ